MAGKTAKSKANGNVVSLPQRRERYHRLLPDPRQIDTSQGWSRTQDALSGVTDAQTAMLLWESSAFQQTVQPMLDRKEAERVESQKRKRPFLYSVTEIERAMIFKAISGINLMKELREKLGGDNPEPRQTLGFDVPRDPDRKRTLMDGVPSEATLCRHRKLFDRRERADAYARCFELLRDEHFIEFKPELLDESRILGVDGSKIEIEGVCPIYDPKDTEKKHPINEKRITCPDGGYVGNDAPLDHRGHGFNIVTIPTASRLPLVFEVTPLHESEYKTCERLLDKLDRDVLSSLPERQLGVFCGDSAFSGNSVRRRVRELGMVENIHRASHADNDKVRARTDGKRKERIPIKGVEHWMTDGLYQLVCKCGHGTVKPIYDFDRNGRTLVRAEGTCKHGCGTFTMTSGWWKLVQNPRRWMKVEDTKNLKELAKVEFAGGNPLSYDSPVSASYGRVRRSCQEGMHSVMAKRMGLTTGKRRYNTIQDARADVAMGYAMIHLLRMIQRRADASRTPAPPLTAPPLAA